MARIKWRWAGHVILLDRTEVDGREESDDIKPVSSQVVV